MIKDLGLVFPIYDEHQETSKDRVKKEKKGIQSFRTRSESGVDTGLLGENLFKAIFSKAKFFPHPPGTPSKSDFIFFGKNLDVKSSRSNSKVLKRRPNWLGPPIPDYIFNWYEENPKDKEKPELYAFIQINSDSTLCYLAGIVTVETFIEERVEKIWPGNKKSFAMTYESIWKNSILSDYEDKIDFQYKK